MLTDEIKHNVMELINLLKSLPDKQFDFDATNHISCGTAACVAGWACFIADGEPEEGSTFDMRKASQFLGIDFNNNSILDIIFNNSYEYTKSKQEVINMLQHYHDTGEITWGDE